jgi:hypothetical protein
MVKYEMQPSGAVTVSFEQKALSFRVDSLPADWEALLRDPDVAECVNELVRAKGGPAGAGAPIGNWDDVNECVMRTTGAAGSG